MTIREFIDNLWLSTDFIETMTLEDAEFNLQNFRADEWDVPEDLDAETFMIEWNSLVLDYYEADE